MFIDSKAVCPLYQLNYIDINKPVFPIFKERKLEKRWDERQKKDEEESKSLIECPFISYFGSSLLLLSFKSLNLKIKI